ncbi:MAG: hypothetical protein KGJ06_01730 [Pseudomonadota bacterium]|nr:hypothetical protein [Pseudomonadota bacterium]
MPEWLQKLTGLFRKGHAPAQEPVASPPSERPRTAVVQELSPSADEDPPIIPPWQAWEILEGRERDYLIDRAKTIVQEDRISPFILYIVGNVLKEMEQEASHPELLKEQIEEIVREELKNHYRFIYRAEVAMQEVRENLAHKEQTSSSSSRSR